ncbi:MAG: hypothetical protein KC572_11575 [Gammaproteobacteria bacterium]|nr:hypothetical protein [Gammaproteobacteria bacterium]
MQLKHFESSNCASALSRSMHTALTMGGQASISCRQWRMLLPRMSHGLLAYGG